MRAHPLDAGAAEHAVVGVPAEDLVGEEVQVLVDAEAASLEELVERDLYERYGSRVSRCCCIATASRRDCSPFSGETMLSVMNAR